SGALREDGLVVPATERLEVGAGLDLLLLLGAERQLPEREHAAQGPALLRPAALLPALLPALLQALLLALLPALLPAPVLAELDQILDHHRLQVCVFHGLDHRLIPPPHGCRNHGHVPLGPARLPRPERGGDPGA